MSKVAVDASDDGGSDGGGEGSITGSTATGSEAGTEGPAGTDDGSSEAGTEGTESTERSSVHSEMSAGPQRGKGAKGKGKGAKGKGGKKETPLRKSIRAKPGGRLLLAVWDWIDRRYINPPPMDDIVGYHLDAVNGKADEVRRRLFKKQAIDAVDSRGYTALMWACYEGHVGVVRILLQKGADTQLRTKKMRLQASHIAAAAGRHRCLSWILGELTYQELNLQDKQGMTAMMHAAAGGHIDALDELADAGADIDYQDKDGWSTLHYAVLSGSLPMVELVLDAGADKKLKDVENRTAGTWARALGHWAIGSYIYNWEDPNPYH